MMRLVFLCTLALLALACRAASPLPGCGSQPADIVFLLDSSGSVGTTNFRTVKDFVKLFAISVDIGPNAVQIGVVTFGTTPRLEFWPNTHADKAELLKAVDAVTYAGSSTHTAMALQFVRQNVFTKAHGDRAGAANLLVVVTDGQSNHPADTLREAALLHQTNVRVLALGVGGHVSQHELSAIASNPHDVINVQHFSGLHTDPLTDVLAFYCSSAKQTAQASTTAKLQQASSTAGPTPQPHTNAQTTAPTVSRMPYTTAQTTAPTVSRMPYTTAQTAAPTVTPQTTSGAATATPNPCAGLQLGMAVPDAMCKAIIDRLADKILAG